MSMSVELNIISYNDLSHQNHDIMVTVCDLKLPAVVAWH